MNATKQPRIILLILFVTMIAYTASAQTVTGSGEAKALVKWIAGSGGGGGGGEESTSGNEETTSRVTTTTLYYDSVYKRFGVHTSTPSAPMHVIGRTVFEGDSLDFYNRLYLGHSPDFYLDSSNLIGYLGFNVYRAPNNAWYRNGDQTHNGSSLLMGNTEGKLFFGTIASTGGSTAAMADTSLLSNLKMVLTDQGRLGIGTGSPGAQMEIVHADDLKPALILNQESREVSTNEIQFHQEGNEKWAIGCHLNDDHPNSFFIWNHDRFRTVFMINNDSLIGINTVNPAAMLEVNGSFRAKTVGIGTAPPAISNTFKLFVEGGIKAREMKVTVNSFADHVFSNGYPLLPISGLDQYIQANGRLPNIPSAEEVTTEGMNLGEMQVKLLEKIEEQALYIIDLQKQINELKALLVTNGEERK